MQLAANAPKGFPALYRRSNCGTDSYEALSTVAPPGVVIKPLDTHYTPEIQGYSTDGTRSVFRADAPRRRKPARLPTFTRSMRATAPVAWHWSASCPTASQPARTPQWGLDRGKKVPQAKTVSSAPSPRTPHVFTGRTLKARTRLRAVGLPNLPAP